MYTEPLPALASVPVAPPRPAARLGCSRATAVGRTARAGIGAGGAAACVHDHMTAIVGQLTVGCLRQMYARSLAV